MEAVAAKAVIHLLPVSFPSTVFFLFAVFHFCCLINSVEKGQKYIFPHHPGRVLWAQMVFVITTLLHIQSIRYTFPDPQAPEQLCWTFEHLEGKTWSDCHLLKNYTIFGFKLVFLNHYSTSAECTKLWHPFVKIDWDNIQIRKSFLIND